MKPLLIALCGAPGSGKTEIQRILNKYFGIMPIDDGYPLRLLAVSGLGVSMDDCLSQDGKAKRVALGSRNEEIRWWLGEFGKALESHFGENIIPEMALEATRRLKIDSDTMGFSFGSVRRNQARVYTNAGGFVFYVERPMKSGLYDFDKNIYIPDDAILIKNDGMLDDLHTKVANAMWEVSERLQNVA